MTLIGLVFPVTLDFNGWHVSLHAITEILSFFIGYRYYRFLKAKQGDSITTENRLWIILGAALGALIGSRLVGGLENPIALRQSDYSLQYFYINKTALGGFLGGLWGVELIKMAIKEKRKSGDLFVYPIILALIIGRIGCFSMGVHEETYGLPTSLFLGMDLGDGLMRHPVSLYEISFLLALWTALRIVERRTALEEGGLFKLFMIAYLIFRLILDFIKPHYTWGIGLSTIQMVSLMGLVYYANYLIEPKKLLKQQYA